MLAPKLRFKDDNGREFAQWREYLFENIYNLLNTNSFSRENLNYFSGTVKNIHYGDIHKKFSSHFLITKETVPFINNIVDISNIANENYCQNGDLIIADASEDYLDIGKAIEIINLDNQNVLAGLHTILARPKNISVLSKGFIGYLFQTAKIRLQLQKIATGISVLGISKTNLAKINLFLPTKQEQTKIANFLTTLDTRINQQEKQCQLLDQYKKGMMQQLFSQKLRFKDDNGDEFPKWQEASLGKLFEQRVERADGSELLLSVTQHQGIVKYEDLDRKDNSSDDKTNYLKVYNGDIAYNSMRMWQGASGKSYWNGIVSPAYTVLKGNEQISTDFFCYLFKTDFAIHLFKKYSQGLTSDTWNLKYNKFSKIEISFPCLEEQTKIAHFLSTLDDKITLAKQQLEQLNTYKKGLLQQLFI